MSEVHCLLLSLKNSLAPINRIPPEVLSLIPDHFDEEDNSDRDLITLTHVCHRWRNTLTSRPSLWTKLDLMNVDKTRTYIQRSHLSPLQVNLINYQHIRYLEDAFSLFIPHIHRLKNLFVQADVLPVAFNRFRCPTPHLKVLNIDLQCQPAAILDSALFGGDLTSLHQLSLKGNITNLPWKTLANLRGFLFAPRHPVQVTQLLDFFDFAPLLQTIKLTNSFASISDAPPERIVHLHNLNRLSILAEDNPPPTLLNHLYIPTGASVELQLSSYGEGSPLLDYFPETPPNLKNLTHVTAVNLCFRLRNKYVGLSGPSGSLHLDIYWGVQGIDSYTMDRRILHSRGLPILSTTQKLTVSEYGHFHQNDPKRCPVFKALTSATDLRTLTLTECNNLPFILALDPEKNPSKSVLCPKLEQLILYIRTRDQFHTEHLNSMAGNRVRRGVGLSSVTVFGLGELVPGEGVLRLREHVRRVEYRVEDEPPTWDYVPGEDGDESN